MAETPQRRDDEAVRDGERDGEQVEDIGEVESLNLETLEFHQRSDGSYDVRQRRLEVRRPKRISTVKLIALSVAALMALAMLLVAFGADPGHLAAVIQALGDTWGIRR